MKKTGKSPLDRAFAGTAVEYQPGRLFGECYVKLTSAKAEFYKLIILHEAEIAKLKATIAQASADCEALQDKYDAYVYGSDVQEDQP